MLYLMLGNGICFRLTDIKSMRFYCTNIMNFDMWFTYHHVCVCVCGGGILFPDSLTLNT